MALTCKGVDVVLHKPVFKKGKCVFLSKSLKKKKIDLEITVPRAFFQIIQPNVCL